MTPLQHLGAWLIWAAEILRKVDDPGPCFSCGQPGPHVYLDPLLARPVCSNDCFLGYLESK